VPPLRPTAALIIGAVFVLSACSAADDADNAVDPTGNTTPVNTPNSAPNGSTSNGSTPNGTVPDGATSGTSRTLGTRPADVQDLTITISGMSVMPNSDNTKVSWGIVYRNPNTNWIAEGVTVKVSLLDATDKEVGTDTFITKVVAPETDAAAANVLRVPGATKMTASFTTDSWRRTDTKWPAFGIGEVKVDHSSINGSQFKTIVSSPYKVPVRDFTVVVIAAQGLTVSGGDALVVAATPAKGVLPVTILAGGVFPNTVNGARFFVLPSTLPSPEDFAPDGAPVPTTKPPATTTTKPR